MKHITFEDIKKNKEFQTYIEKGDELLGVLGFTEHSFVHAGRVSYTAASILADLGYGERERELGKIAGYIHDIGNMINRIDHAQTGAILAFNILTRMEMPPEEIATIVSAIGNHDEGTGQPVNTVSAALILADKTDVRRSRVRNRDFATFDIHDRVNYAVEDAKVKVDSEKRIVLLEMKIDITISSLMEYFEIFLNRMMMCRKAADFLGAKFELVINGTKLL
ncbi:HD domain-containing protein [Clostridium sp. MSJ-11]|uniref:HD domain-containing protein n=1 Tax=Clostridium mobile TaxID=2841512 RepID=A0ABS6EH12_9CLOT|nr:HD domain-containing protein [Clostridium mobile]MBU5484504.1 HD domain-containing protein [Clostridium mobile]